jgi:hypothetical protein
MNRDPETIQREIERSRDALAGTLDQLADRTSPKRLAGVARNRALEFAASPPGLAVLGGVTLLVALGVSRRTRKARRAGKG